MILFGTRALSLGQVTPLFKKKIHNQDQSLDQSLIQINPIQIEMSNPPIGERRLREVVDHANSFRRSTVQIRKGVFYLLNQDSDRY